MADLSELQSSGATKIVGSDATGNEISPVASSPNLELFVRDVLQTAAVYGAISVSTTAVEAKVGASRLSNRKCLVITPTNGTIYWGFDSSVTAATGMPLFKNSTTTVSAGTAVFLIAATATDVRVAEAS